MHKKPLIITVAIIVALCAGAWLFTYRSNSQLNGATVTADSIVSPADAHIRRAHAIIEVMPMKADGFNLLAAAYVQKARETGDFSYNSKAGEQIERSLAIEPENLDALKLKATLLVTLHRFDEAVEFARGALRRHPDTPDLYGALADSLVELGDYDKAVEAAQKMMNLRPDGTAYSRAAYLRALHGDIEGSIEALAVAVRAAGPRDREPLAWYRVNLGNALAADGKLTQAEREYDAALIALPDYHLALAAKARLLALTGDYAASGRYYQRAQARVQIAEVAMALGDLYTVLQQPDSAKEQYEFAESLEAAETAETGVVVRELALFWADHDNRLDEALAAMRRERQSSSDIYASDALAWCLFKKGNLTEARKAIDEAMRLGTRDSLIYYHAGMIYKGQGESEAAERFLKLALATRISFDNSPASFGALHLEQARRALQEIQVSRSLTSRSRPNRLLDTPFTKPIT